MAEKKPKERALRVGELIVQIRQGIGMSRLALSKRAGMSDVMIYYIESGERNPSPDTLHRLERALERPTNELLSAWFREQSDRYAQLAEETPVK